MKVTLIPLEGKYYSTELLVEDENWEGSVYITVAGHPTWTPSPREIENGWEPDYGMDHVEDHGTYNVALIIKEALEYAFGSNTD